MTKKSTRKTTAVRLTSRTPKKETTSKRSQSSVSLLGVLLGFLPRKYRLPVLAALTLMAIMVVVACAGLFFFTGLDPLGLFTAASDQVAPSVQMATDTVDDWWQVYFTDPNRINDPENLKGSIPEKLIEYIDGAQETIHIASFEFNLTPVADALIAAHERGVEVQWVTDDEHGIEADEEEGHGQFEMLEHAGIEVKDDGRGALMHNKFWIFDSRVVWTGSTNITTNGNFRNNNNVIVIESPELAVIYEREFQEMWNGEFGPTSPSTVDQQALTIDSTQIQVLFAAEDEVVSKLVPLVESAESSVRVMAFAFTHDDLGAALLERAEAGVDVKAIFETRGSETEYSELRGLYCAGVPARQDGNPGTFHHKVFIIDDEIVVTGSLNFSSNADDSNDENVLVIANKDIAAEYLQEFDRRWAEAEEPDPEDMGCK
jgi:phosphatidylserine/phosphatidylglycerophosphate/cardiolipin synthase-like enzyme